MTYPLHERAHAYALHCLGVHETPDGSNRGPVQVTHPNGGVSLFEEHDYVAGEGYAWCVTLWLASWALAGHPIPYLSPGAHAQGDWARAHGWATTIEKLVPGDGLDWAIGAGHLSMFESYDRAAGLVTSIDGNWGNKVQRITHRARDLRTAIHVPETHALPPEPAPFWVIATSANGHKQLLFTQFATEKAILNKVLPRIVARYGKAGITIKRGGVRKR